MRSCPGRAVPSLAWGACVKHSNLGDTVFHEVLIYMETGVGMFTPPPQCKQTTPTRVVRRNGLTPHPMQTGASQRVGNHSRNAPPPPPPACKQVPLIKGGEWEWFNPPQESKQTLASHNGSLPFQCPLYHLSFLMHLQIKLILMCYTLPLISLTHTHGISHTSTHTHMQYHIHPHMQYHIHTCPHTQCPHTHTHGISHTHTSPYPLQWNITHAYVHTHTWNITCADVHTCMKYHICTCPHTYGIKISHMHMYTHTHMQYHIPTYPCTSNYTHACTHTQHTTMMKTFSFLQQCWTYMSLSSPH